MNSAISDQTDADDADDIYDAAASFKPSGIKLVTPVLFNWNI